MHVMPPSSAPDRRRCRVPSAPGSPEHPRDLEREARPLDPSSGWRERSPRRARAYDRGDARPPTSMKPPARSPSCAARIGTVASPASDHRSRVSSARSSDAAIPPAAPFDGRSTGYFFVRPSTLEIEVRAVESRGTHGRGPLVVLHGLSGRHLQTAYANRAAAPAPARLRRRIRSCGRCTAPK